MIKVICVIDYYLPGFKGGGPIRTISNMRKMLRKDVEIAIFTRDYDLGSNSSYPAIQANCWNETQDGPVFYASRKKFSASGLKEAMDGKDFDILYLNSFFSLHGSIEIYHKLKRKLESMRILLAPRGEFSIGALNLKRNKKLAYLTACRLFGFYNDIFWHASTIDEEQDIVRQFPNAVGRIYVAEDPVNIGEPPSQPEYSVGPSKELRLIFISRISAMKNLDGLLRILTATTTRIKLDIYGPIEDDEYWSKCQKQIASLPAHVTAIYKGILEPESVPIVFGKYDLFAFPSKGENFGHVIFEALRASTPVLVSDQTPWKSDHKGGLTALPLSNEKAWIEHLNAAANQENAARLAKRNAARALAEKFAYSSGIMEKNLAMFSTISGKEPYIQTASELSSE